MVVVCLPINKKCQAQNSSFHFLEWYNLYVFCKRTKGIEKIILANGNGKTLVHNIRNKANKAAKWNLLGLNIFRFPSYFLSNLIAIMDMGVMDVYSSEARYSKLIKFKFYSSRKKNLTPSSLKNGFCWLGSNQI